ncbi:MAG: hypothetical protein ACPHO6_12410 [Candidatus Latescibacterota bacterium]
MSESETQEAQPVIVTIDDQEYDMNEQSDDAKQHYVEVVNLRNQIAEMQNNLASLQRQIVNAQVALNYRQESLKDSIVVVEEVEEAAG